MTTIRVAEEKDLAGVLALYKELRPNDPVLTETQSEQAWHQLLQDQHQHVIVAEIDGQLASTCQLCLNPTITNGARPFAVIEHVITAHAFRRRGLSFMVMQQAIELAWQLDCYKVLLLSGENRPDAHRLYEKLGFKSGVERGFVLKPEVIAR